jgi:hypothetical protein
MLPMSFCSGSRPPCVLQQHDRLARRRRASAWCAALSFLLVRDRGPRHARRRIEHAQLHARAEQPLHAHVEVRLVEQPLRDRDGMCS